MDANEDRQCLAPAAGDCFEEPLWSGAPVSIPTISDLDAYQRLRAQSAMLLQLDQDIFAWLAESGPRWQSRANAILRREMLLEKGS